MPGAFRAMEQGESGATLLRLGKGLMQPKRNPLTTAQPRSRVRRRLTGPRSTKARWPSANRAATAIAGTSSSSPRSHACSAVGTRQMPTTSALRKPPPSAGG